MATDYNESPYKQYNEPDFNVFYQDTDEDTKQPIKLYTHVKKEDFQKKIPSHYRYLYILRKEVYELNDYVVFHKAETRYPPPPRKTYGQLGAVFTIKQDAITFKDRVPFRYERNFTDIRVPLM